MKHSLALSLAALALLVALPAMAQEAPAASAQPAPPAQDTGNIPAIIYNMCRGGGFAYELQPEYASQRDEKCAADATRLAAELPERVTQLEVVKRALDMANAHENSPAAANEVKLLMGGYNRMLGNVFFIDYCMEQNAKRYASTKDGTCGYVDNRFWGSRWRALSFFLMSGPPPTPQTQQAGNFALGKIFEGFIKLPAPVATVVSDLQASGFTCKETTSCTIFNPLLSYRNGSMNNFGGYTISYKFTLENGQITKVEGVLDGKNIP